MRKTMKEGGRKVRKQLEEQRQRATGREVEQVAVLAEYAIGIQTAINLEGKQPFDYAGIAADFALTAIQRSLEEVKKRSSSEPSMRAEARVVSRKSSRCVTGGTAALSR